MGVVQDRYYMFKTCQMIVDHLRDWNDAYEAPHQSFEMPAFDISYNGTGVFTGEYNIGTKKITPKNVTTIEASSKERDDVRCRRLREGVERALGGKPYPLITFEEVTVSRNFHGMRGVAMAKGIIMSCIKQDLHPILIPIVNTQIKKMLTGDGRADKEQIDEALVEAGMGFYDDNQADAYGAFMLGAGCVWFAHRICEDIEEQDDLHAMSKDILSRVKKAKKEAPFTESQMEVIVSVLKGPTIMKANHKYTYEKARKVHKEWAENN